MDWVKGKALPWLRDRYGLRIRFGSLDQLSTLVGKYWQQAGDLAASVLESLTRSGAILLSWLMNLLLIPVVTFYLLRDWDVMVGHINDLLPRRMAPAAGRLAAEPVVPVLVVFAIGRTLEGTVLTPRLVGGRVGLHPVLVIFAVLAGGRLFGFLGVLLALPVASCVMVFIRHIHDLYKNSDLYGMTKNSLAEPPGTDAQAD